MEKIAEVSEIPEGSSKLITLKEGKQIAVFHSCGQFYALANECPHMGGPLAEGDIEGCRVTCPWHGWEFDIPSGSCVSGGWENVSTYPLQVKEGAIFLISTAH